MFDIDNSVQEVSTSSPVKKIILRTVKLFLDFILKLTDTFKELNAEKTVQFFDCLFVEAVSHTCLSTALSSL